MDGRVFSTALYNEMAILVATGWLSTAELLNIAADFETVPAITLDAIREKAEQFAFVVNQREQQNLFDIIDTAVAEGQTPKELAGVIADTFAEGYHVTTPTEGVVKRIPTDIWSKMVARTELARAQTMGAMALYHEAGIEKVMWVTSQGANVCDICEPRDGEVFDLGDIDEPPLHPNCACALVAADEDVKYEEAA